MSSTWHSVKSLGNLFLGKNQFTGNSLWNKSMGTFHALSAKDIDGNDMSFDVFKGKVLLITNVACKCGYTQGSYDVMQNLSLKYSEKGLKILCFPCNQFMSQEPWNESEIKQWVTEKWPKLNPVLFSKINVNGNDTHPTYKYLKQCFPGDINWNFATKFVVGKDGIPVQRFDKNQKWEEIEECIQKLLESDANDTNNNSGNEKKENMEEENKNNDNDIQNESKTTTKELLLQEMNDSDTEIICLDAEDKEINIKLDANNAELISKIKQLISERDEKQKTVYVNITEKQNENNQILRIVEDAKLV